MLTSACIPLCGGEYQRRSSRLGAVEIAIEASVAHLGRDSANAIIKVVAQKLFTGQELETHSFTGKPSIKSGEVVRPPLDSVRLDLLEQLARSKCPELTHKLFVETLQNLQKVIRKKTAMAVLKADVA